MPVKHIKLYLLVTLLALLTGHFSAQAQATFPVEVTFQGLMNGEMYAYAYVITSGLHDPYNSGVQDLTETCVYFSNQEFDIGSVAVPLTMTVNGGFTFGSTMSDASVYTSSAFFTFTSGSKYITGVSVSTIDGTPFNVIEATNFYRIISLPKNTTFGKLTLTMATHTPLDYAATISGIEATYLDDGVNHPVPTVTYQEDSSSPAITLTEDVDYTVSYNVGSTSGTVTITGMGQYIGFKSKSYNIRQPQLSDFTQLGDGSYEIATTDDLDRLAKFVNNGNNCSGVTFRQTADIAYTYASECTWDYGDAETLQDNHNFTPIGGYGKPFSGTYDGDGHTISGLRIYRGAGSGASDTNKRSVALFGYVSGGTVKNIVLRDANIHASMDFAGIVGYLGGGSVTGCTLYHVRVCTSGNDDNMNIVVGNHASGTVSGNHYRDCIRSYAPTNSGNITERWNNVYTVTAAGVTATPATVESVTIDAVTYYAEGSTFTLAYSGTAPTGYTFDGYTATNGGTVSGSTLTMPASDVTVSATYAAIPWSGSGTAGDPWLIQYPSQLDLLAANVNAGTGYSGKHFRQEADLVYDGTENNYTPVGCYSLEKKSFKGSYDGRGHTISGINVTRTGTDISDGYMGVFGYIDDNGTVSNIVLSGSTFTGKVNVGGIAGISFGTVSDCRVESDVTIGTGNTDAQQHGGIVGCNCGYVIGCISAANVSRNQHSKYYGGIAGNNLGTVRDCIALGATVTAFSDKGAIAGYYDGSTLARNYYHACTVGGTTTNVGTGIGDITDNDGAVRAVSFTTKPAEIGVQIATYPHIGLTVYEHGAYYNGTYYLRHDLAGTAVSLNLTQGTKDGVTAWWGTFYDGTHRYTLPAGAAAYTMDSEYKLYRLGTDGRTIPANTAVVIISDKESITLNFDDSSTPITVNGGDNILKGSDTAVTVTAGKVDGKIPHVLGEVGSTIGFYPYTGTSIPANKAYYVTTP